MSFNYKLAAIDLDGTLLGPDHLIPERNKRAIKALLERGVRCVIASGRMHESTTCFAQELDLEEPIISYNGAMVRDPITDATWHHLTVPEDPARDVIIYCRENGYHLNYYLNNHLFAATFNQWAELYVNQTHSPLEVVGDLTRFCGTRPTKMILINSPAQTDSLLPYFRERLGDELYITKSNPEYLEFMNAKADKGSALKLVADRMGVKQSEVMAFGDGGNDMPMLQWAGLGVAMGEATPVVQASADSVASCYEMGGLGAFIEGLLRD